MSRDPIDKIRDIIDSAGSDRLTRIAEVLGFDETPEPSLPPAAKKLISAVKQWLDGLDGGAYEETLTEELANAAREYFRKAP